MINIFLESANHCVFGRNKVIQAGIDRRLNWHLSSNIELDNLFFQRVYLLRVSSIQFNGDVRSRVGPLTNVCVECPLRNAELSIHSLLNLGCLRLQIFCIIHHLLPEVHLQILVLSTVHHCRPKEIALHILKSIAFSLNNISPQGLLSGSDCGKMAPIVILLSAVGFPGTLDSDHIFVEKLGIFLI